MNSELKEIKTYIVNLNDNPQDKWLHIIDIHMEKIKGVIEKMDEIFIQKYGKWGGNILMKAISGVFKLYKNKSIYYEELESMALFMRIPIEKVMLLQIFYELFSSNTSIVINKSCPDVGNIHVNTFDSPLPLLKNVTINIEVTKNNNVLYRATTFAGYIGVLTGLKLEYGSIALHKKDMTYYDILTSLKKGDVFKWPAGFLIRHIMESDYNREEIISRLRRSHLITPCYFVFCGLDQYDSFIMTRKFEKYEMKIMTDTFDQVLVQTNHDANSADYNNNHNMSIERKQMAETISKEIYKNLFVGKSIDDDKIMKVLLEPPIINEETICITIMRPYLNKLVGKVVDMNEYVW